MKIFFCILTLLTIAACSDRWDTKVQQLLFDIRPQPNGAVLIKSYAAVPGLHLDTVSRPVSYAAHNLGTFFTFSAHPALKSPFQNGVLIIDTSYYRDARPGIARDPYHGLITLQFEFASKAEVDAAYHAIIEYFKPVADSVAEVSIDSTLPAFQTVFRQRFADIYNSSGSPIRYISITANWVDIPVSTTPNGGKSFTLTLVFMGRKHGWGITR